MADVPAQLKVGDRDSVFERKGDLFAVRGSGKAGADAVAEVTDSPDERFVVYKRGAAGASRSAGSQLPVYAAGGDGPLAVPTGRILVRLENGESAKEYAEAFEAAGFEIDRLLSYAPHAAWLRPRGGDVAEALRKLETLARLPGVVHVEPQLLMQRAEKS